MLVLCEPIHSIIFLLILAENRHLLCCLLLLSRLKAAMTIRWRQVGDQTSGLAWFVHITDLHISQFSAEDRTRQLLQLGQPATMNHCPRNVSAHNPIITY